MLGRDVIVVGLRLRHEKWSNINDIMNMIVTLCPTSSTKIASCLHAQSADTQINNAYSCLSLFYHVAIWWAINEWLIDQKGTIKQKFIWKLFTKSGKSNWRKGEVLYAVQCTWCGCLLEWIIFGASKTLKLTYTWQHMTSCNCFRLIEIDIFQPKMKCLLLEPNKIIWRVL